jgi:hypothetical protein
VRFERRGKKNLTLAFHFQLSGPEKWLCHPCRDARLETKRRCGWLDIEFEPQDLPVWTRRKLYTTCCPKPLIKPRSIAWIEGYVVMKRLGGGVSLSTSAKEVDAFLLLEDLVAKERFEIATTGTRERQC